MNPEFGLRPEMQDSRPLAEFGEFLDAARKDIVKAPEDATTWDAKLEVIKAETCTDLLESLLKNQQ